MFFARIDHGVMRRGTGALGDRTCDLRLGDRCIRVWPYNLASLLCRDEAHRIITNQADIAWTKRGAP